MARKKVKLTRPELRRQRDMLQRFERYLPMLKLKQQQLQMTMRQVAKKRRQALDDLEQARRQFQPYRPVLADRAGVNVEQLAEPEEVQRSTNNIAGVALPVFEGCSFPQVRYSLFATPPWVDRAVIDLRDLTRRRVEADILQEQYRLLEAELTKIIQRVNLFEKVKIPECREAIRLIRIRLGDEMTAGVGRAKIAKSKIEVSEAEDDPYGEPAHAHLEPDGPDVPIDPTTGSAEPTPDSDSEATE